MADLSLKSTKLLSASSSSGLICRLRQKQDSDGQVAGSTTTGEVDLENASSVPMEIKVQMSPLQYLDLLVTDSSGQIVSDWFYGESFSPAAEPYTLRLEAGEKYTGPVSLLGNVPREKRRPGYYYIQAVFEYKTLRAVSEPIQILCYE